MNSWLETKIEFLKGVGPQRAKLLHDELSIFTFHDLLLHFPFRYQDRSQFQFVKDIPFVDGFVQLKGIIRSVTETGIGRQKRLTAKFQDNTGTIDLIWFQGINFIKPTLKPNTEFIAFGKAKLYGNTWNIAHPELSILQPENSQLGWQPMYSSTEKLTSAGLHSKGIHRLVLTLLEQMKGIHFAENIPHFVVQKYKLFDFVSASFHVHAPTNFEQTTHARNRFKIEELLHLQIELLLRKAINTQKNKGIVIEKIGKLFNSFYEKNLPFPLTDAQKRVLREIFKDLKSGHQMNRLLQGDVGSGKTVVALLTMLMGIDSGLQSALMAPTEILASQHFKGIADLLMNTGINAALLTGSTKKSERKIIHEKLKSGEIQILIGTHALLEDVVEFQNLGIVVIDEQHRFGVEQRSKLWKKNTVNPHVLVMTATPIPRTLAMTFYGDLDVSVIDELPPGRKPITTKHYFEKDRLQVFEFIRKEIQKGRQVYIVYPLIEESETLDYQNLTAGFESISRSFPLPHYRVSIVHGKLKPDIKDYEMQQFVSGITQIMVATTVIEVGVNVPNASVMLIESAERFGLSQLHQLRGRVGRGAEQSFCLLMTGNKLSSDSKKRINTMVRTNDGFEISEVDLQLRGPGDIMGTQQSGTIDLKIADLAKDGPLVAIARELAREIINSDPRLEKPEHVFLRQEAIKRLKDKPNWAEIS